MLKQMQKTACALVVLACTTSAVMAESVDVKVIGTINPVACTPTLAGGGVIDYGVIKNNTLAADAYTVLPVKSLAFNIVCEAPAKVAVRTASQRPNTAAGGTYENVYGFAISPVMVPGVGSNTASNSNGVAGLGLDGTAKIGGYGMSIYNILLDGVAAKSAFSSDNGATWSTTSAAVGQASRREAQALTGFATTATTNDTSAFTTMSGSFNVQAYINKASSLDLTKPVVLDGLSTISLVYL